MQTERFYTGECKEENVPNLLKASKNPKVDGVSEGKEWLVFVSRVAANENLNLRFEKLTHALEPYVVNPKLAGQKNISGPIDQIFNAVMVKSKVDENELMGRLIRKINETVMHELSIHQAANLKHYPISCILDLPGLGLDVKEVTDILSKLSIINQPGLKAVLMCDETGTMVKKIELDGAEKLEEKTKEACNELKARGLEVKLNIIGKTYPIIFELDDIKILKREDQQAPLS